MHQSRRRNVIEFSFHLISFSLTGCELRIVFVRSLSIHYNSCIKFPFMPFVDHQLNISHALHQSHRSTFREVRLPEKYIGDTRRKRDYSRRYEVAKSRLHDESLSAPATRNSLPFLHFSNTSLERSTRIRISVKSCVAHTTFSASSVREFFASSMEFPINPRGNQDIF